LRGLGELEDGKTESVGGNGAVCTHVHLAGKHIFCEVVVKLLNLAIQHVSTKATLPFLAIALSFEYCRKLVVFESSRTFQTTVLHANDVLLSIGSFQESAPNLIALVVESELTCALNERYLEVGSLASLRQTISGFRLLAG